MEKTMIATGKTIDLAIEEALTQLGLTRDDVSVQVLATPKAGFLGLGGTPAKVEVTYEAPDPKPISALGSASRSKPKVNNPAPAPKQEAPKQEAKPQPKKEQPKKEQPKKEQPKKEQPEQPSAENKGDHKRRRRPPHRRRPKSGGEPKAE